MAMIFQPDRSRRTTLRSLAAITQAVALVGLGSRHVHAADSAPKQSRPNIVLIITDDKYAEAG